MLSRLFFLLVALVMAVPLSAQPTPIITPDNAADLYAATTIGKTGEILDVLFPPVAPWVGIVRADGVFTYTADNLSEPSSLFMNPFSGVSEAALNRDGSRLAYGAYSRGLDAAVLLWNAVNGDLIATLPGSADGMPQLAFHPDGEQLATTDAEGIRVWSAETGRETGSIDAEEAFDLTYSPDGRLLAAGSIGAVRVWDSETLETVTSLDLPPETTIQSITFSPNSERILVDTWNEPAFLYVWEVGDAEAWAIEKPALSTSAVFSPDSAQLAVAPNDDDFFNPFSPLLMVRLYDVESREEAAAFNGHGGLTYDESGLLFRMDRLLFRWDGAITPVYKPTPVERYWISPDGSQMLITHTNTNEEGVIGIVLQDLSTGQASFTGWRLSYGGGAFAFSPDGIEVATGSNGPRLWNVYTLPPNFEGYTLSPASPLAPESFVGNILYSPDGARLLYSIGTGNTGGWKLMDRQFRVLAFVGGVYPTPYQQQPSALAINGDGTQIVSGYRDGTVRVWDVAQVLEQVNVPLNQGEEMRVFESGFIVTDLIYQDDLILIAGTPAPDTTLEHGLLLYDPETGEVVRSFNTNSGVTGIGLSPDGTQLAAVLSDGSLHRYDTESGALLNTVSDMGTGDVVFSPDGELMLWLGQDRFALIDSESGEVVFDHTLSAGSMFSTQTRGAFHPSGTYLLIGSIGMPTVWRVPDGG